MRGRPRKTPKPIELDACTDSPTGYHHFRLPTPDGTKMILGVCKYCGDHKIHPITEHHLGYNNRSRELNKERQRVKHSKKS